LRGFFCYTSKIIIKTLDNQVVVNYNRSTMSYIVTKYIKGRPYLYLVHSEREGKKVKQVFEEYLGPAGGDVRMNVGSVVVNRDKKELGSVAKLAKKIERAKTESQKNALFLAVDVDDRSTLLQHIILSMPQGKYLLKREGRASPSLEREIINKYGTFAGTNDLEKIVRGLSITHPDRVSANFTLGLDELTLKHPAVTPVVKSVVVNRKERITWDSTLSPKAKQHINDILSNLPPNIQDRVKEIRINPNLRSANAELNRVRKSIQFKSVRQAENVTPETIYHEIGHTEFDNLVDNNRSVIDEYSKKLGVTFDWQALEKKAASYTNRPNKVTEAISNNPTYNRVQERFAREYSNAIISGESL